MKINPGIVFMVVYLLALIAFSQDTSKIITAVIFGLIAGFISFYDYVSSDKK